MDDEQYRQTRLAMSQPACLYEKALQYGYYRCQHAHNFALGEREAIQCLNGQGHAYCHEYYVLSLRKSGFALGAASLPTHLTFNNAMKVQIGGLQGAMQLAGMSALNKPPVLLEDVADCFNKLKRSTEKFSRLDFSRVVPYIQKFSLRKHRHKNNC